MRTFAPGYMFLMRDEKEERKKQARSNKQTRQSNTAYVHATEIDLHCYTRRQWPAQCATFLGVTMAGHSHNIPHVNVHAL